MFLSPITQNWWVLWLKGLFGFVSIIQLSDFWVISYGNWKYILGVFKLSKLSFHGILVNKQTWLGPTSLVKSLSFSLPPIALPFFFFSTFLSFCLSSFSILRCTPFSSLFFYFLFFVSSSHNIFDVIFSFLWILFEVQTVSTSRTTKPKRKRDRERERESHDQVRMSQTHPKKKKKKNLETNFSNFKVHPLFETLFLFYFLSIYLLNFIFFLWAKSSFLCNCLWIWRFGWFRF